MECSLIFSGKICSEHSEESVRASLAKLLRLTDERKLDRLFSGQPIVLKSGLSAEQAKKFQLALQQTGADCEIRSPAKPPATASSLQAPSSAEAAASDPFSGFAAEAPPSSLPTAEKAKTPLPAASSPTAVNKSSAASSLDGLSLIPIEKPAEAPEPAPAPAQPVMPAASAVTRREATPPYRSPKAALVESNSSGAGREAYVPDEVGGLCWGGFFLSFFWSLRHGAYKLAALCFVPFINIAVPFYLLLKGRGIAWQNIRWSSAEQFNKEQRWWSIIGLVIALFISYQMLQASREVQRRVQATSAMNPAEVKAAQQEMLGKIEDPAQRESMRQLYERLNKIAEQKQASQ